MTNIKRRDFIKLVGGTTAVSMFGFPALVLGASRKVVVVGGGVGGCTVSKYLRKLDPSIEVTLVTDKDKYATCFLSNEVLGGDRAMESITHGYDGLKKQGVEILIDRVVNVDPAKKAVQTAGGKTLNFDACVVSPGVDFKWETIDGYDQKVAESIPHAWFAGPQTMTLRKQIEAMPAGGTVVIAAPPNPFKCPPGPYERASQIAMYCKQHKPKAKIVILDPKPKFSKQKLFIQGWTDLYGYGTDNSMIEWVSGDSGGAVTAVDAANKTLTCAAGKFKGDVVNVIPAQKAGKVAFDSDLVDGEWCPVDKKTFESKKHAGIYVLGDASDSAKMPKSAYAANSQAKVCAAAIADRLNGREPGDTTYVNTCYSIVGEDYGISVAAVYQLDAANNMIESIKGSGGVSPMDAGPEIRKREVAYAHSWYNNLIDDMMM